jgi:hypothetical protein
LHHQTQPAGRPQAKGGTDTPDLVAERLKEPPPRRCVSVRVRMLTFYMYHVCTYEPPACAGGTPSSAVGSWDCWRHCSSTSTTARVHGCSDPTTRVRSLITASNAARACAHAPLTASKRASVASSSTQNRVYYVSDTVNLPTCKRAGGEKRSAGKLREAAVLVPIMGFGLVYSIQLYTNTGGVGVTWASLSSNNRM